MDYIEFIQGKEDGARKVNRHWVNVFHHIVSNDTKFRQLNVDMELEQIRTLIAPEEADVLMAPFIDSIDNYEKGFLLGSRRMNTLWEAYITNTYSDDPDRMLLRKLEKEIKALLTKET